MTASYRQPPHDTDPTSPAHPGGQPAVPPQLVLDLPHHTALGRRDFLIGPPNRAAVDLVDQWPNWPSPAVLLVGPAGSGKSHLVTIWRERTGAVVLPAAALREHLVAPLAAARAIAIEDVDRLGTDAAAAESERIVFHLLNLAREQRTTVLVTSRLQAGAFDPMLPDLRSRLRALPFAALDAPDDALLSGLLVKLFNDRQIKVEPAVITYLVRHMERTMAAAHTLVAEIDARALAAKRAVTRALAAEVLARSGDVD